MAENNDALLQALPFDARLYTLLETNNGVFIGERHNWPAMRQSLEKIAPALRARGVTTLSVEVDQDVVDWAIQASSQEEFVSSPRNTIDTKYYSQDLYSLIQTYNSLGIKVIGHEQDETKIRAEFSKAYEDLVEDYTQKARQRVDKQAQSIKDPHERETFKEYGLIKELKGFEKSKDYQELINSPRFRYLKFNEMSRRNALAADFINENKRDGKLLVLGGAKHSHHNMQAPTDPDNPDEKEGLDKRLGIPSINISAGQGGAVGSTIELEEGQSYEVIFPADLRRVFKDNAITAWPPEGGVPYVEHSGAASVQSPFPKQKKQYQPNSPEK